MEAANMGYKPSPRPTFDGPSVIAYDQVTRHLWGDIESGQVEDWIYASTNQIHQLVFRLAPGGKFTHSENYRTIFGADEVLYILSGHFGLANPLTGEFHLGKAGEAFFFRKGTWHHGFNLGSEQVRVLEYFAPPPSQGTSGAYAESQPFLQPCDRRYLQSKWLGQWPMARSQQLQERSIVRLTDADALQSLDETTQGAYTQLFVATEHLTSGKTCVLPGQKTGPRSHSGDLCIYLNSGTLNVYVPKARKQQWFALQPRDGFYLPKGYEHQFFNQTEDPVEFLFGHSPA